MKKKPSRKNRRENWDDFDQNPDDVTITPYLSSSEIYKRFGAPSDKPNTRETFDAFGDSESDLWNKGTEGFKQRRRNSLATEKSRRRAQAREDEKEARNARADGQDADAPKRSKRNRNVGSEPGFRGDSAGLRIVGGVFRGTKLEYAGDRRVRPMGKVEEDEFETECLHREFHEELGISIIILKEFMPVEYDYPKFHITLYPYEVAIFEGEITLNEHTDSGYFTKEELLDMKLTPADRIVVERYLD